MSTSESVSYDVERTSGESVGCAVAEVWMARLIADALDEENPGDAPHVIITVTTEVTRQPYRVR